MAHESVNLDNARLDEQREVMQQIIDDEVCPFCIESLAKYHKQPILHENNDWLLTPNQWPYENTRLHLLAIARSHAETLSELDKNAGNELLDLFQWAEEEYAIASGGLAMRFGDTRQNGSSVSHIHAHLIVPKEKLPPNEKVRFKIS